MSLQLLVETFRDRPRPYAKDINRLTGSWWPTGRILFQDDMESLIADGTNHWRQFAGTIARASDKSYHGQYALKLTTGNVAGNIAYATRYTGLPQYLSRIGLELKFVSNATVANFRSLMIAITRYDGVNAHQCTFYYFGTFGALIQKWRYDNSVGATVDAFAQLLNVSAAEPEWNGVKIIADFSKNTFDSLYCNEKYLDMKGIPLYDTLSNVQPELGIYLELTTETANAISCWIDDVILTDEG